jgi:glycosyltransferase involved in cell wall biosynthesis
VHVDSPSDEKLRELYSQAGVYLLTSRHEGFGLPALEAMACGCPVVCIDAHGNMEFCLHGETALVGASPAELAAHVEALQRDRSAWRRLADAGRATAARYQWPAAIDRLAELFAF